MTESEIWKLTPTADRAYQPRNITPTPPPLSIRSASSLIPAGVYTTFRTFNGSQVLSYRDHIRRLEESAELSGFHLPLNSDIIKTALHPILARYPTPEARVRLTLVLYQEPGVIYVTLEPLRLPNGADYQNGVRTRTYYHQRKNPQAKTTSFLTAAEEIRSKLQNEVEEILLVSDSGLILEGLTSNFFAVKNGVLLTSATGMLAGITRAIVLEVADQSGFPVRFESVSVSEIPALDEAFITSSSRSILPIRQIDQTIIGDGTPGLVTQTLSSAFWDNIRQKLEEI